MMLLSAGLGSRLRPLTDSCPKPLLEVAGRPLIDWNLDLVSRAGFNRVFINLHHLGDQIRGFVADGARWGLQIEYSEEPVLLDTGGGIRAIRERLSSDLLLTLNSDILVERSFPLRELVAFHRMHPSAPKATLVLRPDSQASQYGTFDTANDNTIVRMLDVRRPGAPEVEFRDLMYTGVQVMDVDLIEQMPPRGTVFSLTKDVFRTVIRNGAILGGYRYSGYWNDVGTPERLEAASKTYTGF